MTPIVWTTIVADQYQHAAVVASGLFVFTWCVSVVVVVMWAFADQTSPNHLPKMGWIRPSWIKHLYRKKTSLNEKGKGQRDKIRM